MLWAFKEEDGKFGSDNSLKNDLLLFMKDLHFIMKRKLRNDKSFFSSSD